MKHLEIKRRFVFICLIKLLNIYLIQLLSLKNNTLCIIENNRNLLLELLLKTYKFFSMFNIIEDYLPLTLLNL